MREQLGTKLGVALAAGWLCLSIPTLPVLAADLAITDMEIAREKARADKKLLVSQNMPLTEEEKKVFWPLYNQYQNDSKKLGDRTLALVQDYAKHFQALTDEKARQLLDEYLSIESDRLALRKSYLARFREILPEKKVAQYYQLENKLQAIVNFEMAAQIPLIR